MKHRLTVKIEKRFKRQLSKRFNPRNAQVYDCGYARAIVVNCLLCGEYMENYKCGNCPFKEFKKEEEIIYSTERTVGCVMWIVRTIGKDWLDIFDMGENMVSWDKHNNKKAIELLKKLREKAKKYIVWVENTK